MGRSKYTVKAAFGYADISASITDSVIYYPDPRGKPYPYILVRIVDHDADTALVPLNAKGARALAARLYEDAALLDVAEAIEATAEAAAEKAK